MASSTGGWRGARGGRARPAPSLSARAGAGQASPGLGRQWLAAAIVATGLLGPAPARAGDPRPAVEVLALRPDEQCRTLIALFDGARWPHPAAALADWKRSAPTESGRSLGKPLEALLAAINPMMAQELATLHRARLRLDLDPDGAVRWALVMPEDDGSVAALAAALALTDGVPMPAEGPFRVDRLGPPGSPLAATGGPGSPAIIAADREALAATIARQRATTEPALLAAEPSSGWIVHVDPSALAGSPSPPARQIGRGLLGLGYDAMTARATLRGEALEVVAEPSGRGGAASSAWGAIEPAWLDPVPIGRASVVVALAVGPGRDAWGTLLESADGIERADPARAEVAPLRTRLALLALARGARIEADLWPMLSGVVFWAELDEQGGPTGVFLGLHARDEEAADRIADRVVRRIAGAGNGPGEAIGMIGGRPLELVRRGTAVLVGWGPGVLADAIAAVDDPGRSAGPMLRGQWDGTPPARLVSAWPGRWPLGIDAGGPIGAGVEAAAPIVWLGWHGPDGPRDVLRWAGLREPIRVALDRIPAEPSPSSSAPAQDEGPGAPRP